MRQVAAAERARSANRSPVWLWVPSESFRWMTGLRSARSAGLLVGSTPSIGGEGPERGPDLEQVVGELAVPAVAPALRAGVFEQLPQLGLDRGDLGLEPVAVVVLVLVGAPGGEHRLVSGKPCLAEGLLLAEAVGVAAEVALEV